MAYESSTRRSRLPSDWDARKRAAKALAGHQCEYDGVSDGKGGRRRCTVTWGLSVDHIVPGDDHSPENLRALCEHHHGLKSAREAEDGNARARARREAAWRRPTKGHPGGFDFL